MQTGLYIHIPFCRKKCNYCDFASYAGQENRMADYITALQAEAHLSGISSVQTAYIGGGTPSLLPEKMLEKLLDFLAQQFGPLGNLQECTFEANPESLTPGKLALLRAAGVNRLSLGLQSLDDGELKMLGRVHTRADFMRAYEAARRAGFQNISIDLIAGLPGQTLEKFLENLTGVLALAPQHISVYGLQIEEGTPFFEQGVLCDQILMRRMLEQTHWRLLEAGFEHYEISNFSRPGYFSRHNMHYWDDGEYVGLGSAAASYVAGERRQNTPDIQTYVQAVLAGKSAVCFAERLEGKAKLGERMMLALRKLEGTVVDEQTEQAFGREIQRHIEQGLLVRDGNKLKLTFEGLFLANEVFCSFVAPFEEE